MRGLNATRGLKFNHPGLDTMATRSAGRLLIQNDIGTTDAHVLVIAVKKNSVTVTYTDVHRARAKFFIALFDKFEAKWSGLDRHTAAGLGDDNAFFLVTGQYHAENAADRNAFLEAVGAALVFLIDWNKARKLLRNWVAKDDAVRILDWAARQRLGHRALRGAGWRRIDRRGRAQCRPGTHRLRRAAGPGARTQCRDRLPQDRDPRLDRGAHRRTIRSGWSATRSKPIWCGGSNASTARCLRSCCARSDWRMTSRRRSPSISPRCRRAGRLPGKLLAARAGLIERKADRIAFEARKEVARLNASSVIAQLVDRVEEAVDELEQAAFIASLAPPAIDPALLADACRIMRRRHHRDRSRGFRASPPRWKSRRAAAPIPRMRCSPSSI